MRPRAIVAITLLALAAAACGGTATGGSPSAAGKSLDPTKDKLAQVLARGTLVLLDRPGLCAAVDRGQRTRPARRTPSAPRTS